MKFTTDKKIEEIIRIKAKYQVLSKKKKKDILLTIKDWIEKELEKLKWK